MMQARVKTGAACVDGDYCENADAECKEGETVTDPNKKSWTCRVSSKTSSRLTRLNLCQQGPPSWLQRLQTC